MQPPTWLFLACDALGVQGTRRRAEGRGPHSSEPVAAAIARRLTGCGPSELVFCGPGGSNRIPRGARSRLSTGNHRRVYRLAAGRAELPDLDLHGPHDLRHSFATWLEDGGIQPG
jgi:hypothetical protein